MARELEGAVVVLTGASSGIGRAAARRFAEAGARLVLAARSLEALREVAQECTRVGATVLVVRTDVRDYDAVEALAEASLRAFGRLDVWVNNAAVSLFGRLEETPLKQYRQVLDTNLLGTVYGSRAAVRAFREQGTGVLLNVSSLIARTGGPFLSAYVASKAGINGLSESLRQELLDTDIHVVTLLLASIDTPLFQHAANYMGRAVKPLKPIYPADHVARALVQAARSPQREVYVGTTSRLLVSLRKMAPGLLERATARVIERGHYEDRPQRPTSGNLEAPGREPMGITGGWIADEQRARRWVTAATVGLGLSVAAAVWWRSVPHPDEGGSQEREAR
jgi:short-subunit dehydrogenase